MEYRCLGRSSLRVSSLCLGTMNFGGRTGERESIDIVHRAMDAGINFVDTANKYTDGVSETFVGKALAGGRRDQVVLATKVGSPMGDRPNEALCSRYHVMKQVEDSLRRLRTDRIDLYYLHVMDLATPLEESMYTMDTLVRDGKVRYFGVSKWAPALTVEAMALCDRHGWAPIAAEQPPYSIVDRTVEQEMLWACRRHGIGVVPWAPLAGGVLSGKYRSEGAQPADSRFREIGGRLTVAAIEVAERVGALAREKGCSTAALATAWVMHQPGVTAPIIGPRTMEHLEGALESMDVDITAADRARVDEINPPGQAVANYYDGNTCRPLRRELGIET